MSRPNYRVVLSFDGERKVFTARIPELPHCTGEGATRGEAIARIEEDLDAQLAHFNERGTRPPTALDDAQFTGEMKVKVSVGLQRELTWQSHNEGVDVSQLAAELLSSGLEQRRQAGRGPRQRGGNDNIGNSISHDAPRGREFSDRNRGGSGPRFHDMLEDRAAFVDYVRKLEGDGGRPRSDGRPHADNRTRGDGRPQGDNRPGGPQGGHGGHQGGGERSDPRGGGGGGGGRRFGGRDGGGRDGGGRDGGRDNRGGGPRRGPEGRDASPAGGDNSGGPSPPAPPRPHSPSESET